MKNFQARSIPVTAEYRPLVRQRDSALGAFHVQSPVADGEVNPPIHVQQRTVHIVSPKADVDAVPEAQRRPFFCHSIAIGDVYRSVKDQIC